MAQQVFDPTLSLERAGGNQDLADELFAMLVKELPDYRDRLQAAFTDRNLEQIIFIAHRLNGSATYTGVPALKAAAETLELSLKQGKTDGMDKQVGYLDDEINRVLEFAQTMQGHRPATATG